MLGAHVSNSMSHASWLSFFIRMAKITWLSVWYHSCLARAASAATTPVAAKRDQAHLSFRSAEGLLGAPAAGAARASVLGTATGSGSGSATAGGAAGAADFGGAAAAITA